MQVSVFFFATLVLSQASTRDYPNVGPQIIVPVNNEFVSLFPPAIRTTRSGNEAVTIAACSGANDWALTFDDGPSVNTRTVLRELERRNLKGTFFVTGQQTIANQDILKEVIDAGHEIGIHTWSHASLPRMSNEELISDIMYTRRVIQEVTGVEPLFVRPPFGDRDQRVLSVLGLMGFDVILWNKDSADALSGPSAAVAAARQWVGQTNSGSISLQHDLTTETVSVAGEIFDILMSRNFDFKSVSECTGRRAYGALRPGSGELSITTTTTTTTTTTATTTVSTTTTSTTIPPQSAPSKAEKTPDNAASPINPFVSFIFGALVMAFA